MSFKVGDFVWLSREDSEDELLYVVDIVISDYGRDIQVYFCNPNKITSYWTSWTSHIEKLRKAEKVTDIKDMYK